MKIKKNDTVQVMAGKDRGKTGKVIKVYPKLNRVTVEGINIYKKHTKPKKQGQKGEVVSLPRSVQSSNVLIYCVSCARGVRSGLKMEGDKKIRICKKCQKNL